MAIDRDDRDERQARVEWMIREFQDAGRRRLVRVSERAVEPQLETDAEVVSSAEQGPAR